MWPRTGFTQYLVWMRPPYTAVGAWVSAPVVVVSGVDILPSAPVALGRTVGAANRLI